MYKNFQGKHFYQPLLMDNSNSLPRTAHHALVYLEFSFINNFFATLAATCSNPGTAYQNINGFLQFNRFHTEENIVWNSLVTY